jgi:hypothetical protein
MNGESFLRYLNKCCGNLNKPEKLNYIPIIMRIISQTMN